MMGRGSALAILAGAALLAGCANAPLPTPTTAGQAVYEMTAAYASALTVAVAYDHLPDCAAPGAPVLCSQADVRTEIKARVDQADPLVTAAQTIARATSPDATALANAISAATAAVAQLDAITAALKVS